MGALEFIARLIGPAVGLIGAVLLWRMQRRHEARVAQAKETEQRRRMLLALRAELLIAVEAYDAFFGADKREAIETSLKENVQKAEGAAGLPMGFATQSNIVFDEVRAKIANLPPEIIAPIIRYYLADEALSGTLIGFSDPRYEKISAERRLRAVSAYCAQGIDTLAEAKTAFRAIDQYLLDDPDAIRLRSDESQLLQAFDLAALPKMGQTMMIGRFDMIGFPKGSRFSNLCPMVEVFK